MTIIYRWYVHNKTGNKYWVTSTGKMKVEGVWHNCVHYARNDKLYTRTIDDFDRSFTLL